MRPVDLFYWILLWACILAAVGDAELIYAEDASSSGQITESTPQVDATSTLPEPNRMEPLPSELEGVGVDEKLGEQVPLDLRFKDENGKRVTLQELMSPGMPAILTLNYYGCPMLCGLQLNGLLAALKDLDWTPGENFRIITVSFDPTETPVLARNKKQNYLREYGRPEAAPGWHFLTGKPHDIETLTDSVGFKYQWNDDRQEYMHVAAFMVLTPEGVVSRYLYGVMFDPKTIRLSLVEASEGKIGSTFDRFLLFCYHYDPEEGSYALAATRIMSLGALLTVIVLGIGLALLWREDSQRQSNLEQQTQMG